jgi:hypothetical protein
MMAAAAAAAGLVGMKASAHDCSSWQIMFLNLLFVTVCLHPLLSLCVCVYKCVYVSVSVSVYVYMYIYISFASDDEAALEDDVCGSICVHS